MSQEFNPGKIKPLIKTIAYILEQDPSLHNNPDALIAKVEDEIPELKDKSRCANCEAPMTQYVHNLNVLNIALVIAMANDVRARKESGMDFTEANKIHVPTLNTSDAIRHKTTNCAKLGLIAKHKIDGKHMPGIWVITARGFAGLRGEEVPNGIIVWRNKIIERPDNVTTFNKIRAGYKIKVDNYKKRNNLNEYHDEVIDYKADDWIGFDGYHEGKLF